MNLPDMPEAIFRRIWQQQSFSTEHLSTHDGRAIRIIAPGEANTDGGPDFLDAKISIGKIMFHGDVELHISAEEWLSHKHDSDPHYNKVILHVVLTADPLSPPARTASRRAIPLLVLHPFLDETFQHAWMKALADEPDDASHSLPCANTNDDVSSETILEWIEKLSRERIELKMRRFEERLKQLVDETRHIVREPYPRYYGNPSEIPYPKKEYSKNDFTDRTLWEQLLYEGTMEALGYSKNSQPFLTLARSVRLRFLREHSLSDTQTTMALLFGVAGLLPSSQSVHQKESRLYVAALKKKWKTIRPTFKGATLSEGDWLFFRLRPSNFPTARLAAMCFLLPKLFGDDSFRRLVALIKSDSLTQKERLKKLYALFEFEGDEFWQHHYHFKGKAKHVRSDKVKNTVALGSARSHDILVNTIIPIVLLYARFFNAAAARRNARSLLASLPASQENSTTEVIQNQLAKEKALLNSSLLQQGAIQLHRFYCAHTRCLECAIGRTIAEAQKSLTST